VALRKRKSPKQLDREIETSLRDQGQPGLAEIFADPEARQVFAREMRLAIQTKQAAQQIAAHRVARPFTVKHVEQVGERRFRRIVGNYATEAEARERADQLGGWVETRDGRVVYGRSEEI